MARLKVPHFHAIKLNDLAINLFRLGNDVDAERCLNRALLASTINKIPPREDYGHILGKKHQNHEGRRTASIMSQGGYTDKGMRVHRKPVSIRLSPSCDEKTIQKTIYFNLGVVYMRLEQYYEAHMFFSKALSLQVNTSPKDTEEDTSSFSCEVLNDEMIHHNLGYINFKQGLYSEAFSNHSEALRIMIESKGYYHPDVAICLNSMGIDTMSSNSIDNENREERAAGFFMEALAVHKATSCEASRNKHVAIIRNNIARMKSMKGELLQDCDDKKKRKHVSNQPKRSGRAKRWVSQEPASDFWPFVLAQ